MYLYYSLYLEMNLELTYINNGAIHTIPMTGIESEEEKLYKIIYGIGNTNRVYGCQYAVYSSDWNRDIRISTVAKSLSSNHKHRAEIVKYATTVFDAEDRQILSAISLSSDEEFVASLSRLVPRESPKIDAYPIIRVLTSSLHIPIERTLVLKGNNDARHLSPFQNRGTGDKYDLIILPDTLSIDGEGILARVRGLLSKGGTVVVMETDYRDDISDILSTRAMVDYASGAIKSLQRYWKPKFQWHDILEREGLIHLASEVVDEVFRSYVSAYTYLDEINTPIARVFSLPLIVRSPYDLFPKIDGKSPNVVLFDNYDIDDLYSMENSVVKDAVAIYNTIRKVSKTAPIYIDGGGIGLLPVSFSKYGLVYVRTDRISQAVENLNLYRKGKIQRQGDIIKMTAGSRVIQIGRELEIPPSSVVVTTDPSREYPDALSVIRRMPLGTRDMKGDRFNLEMETIFVESRGGGSYPEKELLRLVMVEEIWKLFSQLVPGGNFLQYLFDIITIGQSQGTLLDPVIPVTSSLIVPRSISTSILFVPDDWYIFTENLRYDYPDYMDEYREEIESILVFETDRQREFIERFKKEMSYKSVDIARALYEFSHNRYKFFLDNSGRDVDVRVTYKDNILAINPNSTMISLIGKRAMQFDVTPDMVAGRSYRDVAAMLLRHKILGGEGKVLDTDVTHMFGSPSLVGKVARWMSIFPDVDRDWGSSGSSMVDMPISSVYLNPPYWNEAMDDLLSRLAGMTKVYLPRIFAPATREGTIVLV
jgi:hypothetical protein